MDILACKKILENHPRWQKTISIVYNGISGNNRKLIGKDNRIIVDRSFMKNVRVNIKGNNNVINLGYMNFLTNTIITIVGDNNVINLGEKVYVNSGDFCIEDSNNILDIDSKTTFSGNTHLAVTEGKKIKIGKNCMFSSNVVFRTGDSHSILNEKNERINHAKDIIIGDHVWFTQNTTVLKGVVIGDNSVVATGSVVTKPIQSNGVILVGNPARIVKEGINWRQER